MDAGTLASLLEIIARLNRDACTAIIEACRLRLAKITDEQLEDWLGAIKKSPSEAD